MSEIASEKEREAMLERMLTRLALTDDSKLEAVLAKLLPYAISSLSSSIPSTRQKVMEMLTHINRRVKDQPAIHLPVWDLWKLYQSADSPMVKNFSIVYIEMAFDRLPMEEKINFAPELLNGLSKLPVQHQDILLRIIAQAMECHSNQIDEAVATKYKKISVAEECHLLLGFCLQTILYQPPSSNAEGMTCPAGLSIVQTRRITGKHLLKGEKLSGRKLGILNVIESMDLAAELVYPLYITASIDSQESVSRKGEELLKRKATSANLEDHALINHLFSLFQGTASEERITAEERIAPASPALQARLMSVFSHSIQAANLFPATLRCIFNCIYGNGTNSRLKYAGMEFTVWVFKHASMEQLKLMGPVILSGILKFLDGQAAAEPEVYSRELKAFSYQAIGQLAQRAPQLFRGNVEMAARLFQALKEVDPSSRFTVQEAVNSLATAYKDCNELVSKGLEALLLENSQVVESEARFCAVRWATTLYGLDHCPSRFICMLRAADTKLDIREMALEGLFPQKQVDRTVNQSSQSVPENYPPLKQMLDYISKYQPQVLEVSEIGESKLLFPPKMYVAMLRFLQKCYEAECGQASLDAKGDSPQHVESVILLCLLLEHAMAYEGSVELHATASKGLLNVASQNPQMIASRYAERLPWLKQFLGHIDSDTRESISRLLGITCSALSISSASVLIQELCSTFKVLNKGRFEDSHGAICATGYVVAQCMTGMPSVARELLETSVMVLVDTIKSQTLPLAGAAAEALGHVGLRGHLSDFGQDYQFHNSSGAADMEPLTKGIHEVKTSTKEVSGSISSLIERMKELLGSNDTKVVQKVVIAFGHICHGDTSPRLMDMALDSLFSLSRSKVEDVLFSAGEALAFIWGGVPVSVDEILKSGYTSLSTSSNYLTGEITQHGFIDSMVVETKVVDNGRAKAREKIAKKLFDDLLYSNRKEERCTGSVWLLSLTTYCGQHPKIQELLPAIQEAFSHLLAEQNELTQEMASRGMSIVYDLGNSNTKSELVQALVGTLTGTAKRKHVVKMTEDSEVFEEGSIGERPGGEKLSTYKELCSLATDMGQPDLIYKFMDLANYQASLNSKRGAAFGFSKIAKQAGNALKPHLHSLVPKLVRYQYDPDKNIREAMENIWRSLMADPKKTIDEFFDDVIVDLLTQSGSRLWRSRESSCLALSDLLQGRKFDQVGKYLERVWIIAFRAMDDIKESVRNSGDSLCRAATSLSLRLCDTSLTERSDASATMAIVLPFMLSNGIMSKVATVQKVSINLVMKLAKAAGDAIRPHLPELVFCMLESLSSLEDQRLNYAELHAESVGIQKEKFENLRIAAAKDSPMWETLDLCLKHVDPPTLELLVPRLVQLVRSGVGLNTRVGVARFISFLVQNVGSDIKPFINSLVKILFLAVEREKSSAAKKAFAAACGGLLKYAGSAQAQKMIEDTIALYTSGGDKGTQVASAILLKTFSHQAADIVKGYHTIVLPVVFMARFDDEKDISSLFEEVWEENSSSESVTLQLYLPEIVAVLCDTMLSSSWASKKKSAKAVIMLAETLGESLAPFVQDLLKFLVKEVPGRIWEGKEVVLDATAALCQACHKEISADDPVGPDMLVTLVSSACTKKRKSYREAAFLNLEKIIKAFGKPEFCNMVMPFLLESCSQKYPGKVNQSGSSLDGASAEENGDLPPPLGKVLDCITSIITVAKLPDILEHGKNMIAAFLNSLRPELSWQVKLSAFSAIRAFYGRLRVAASQAVSISSQQAAVQQTLITESFQSLSPLILECISSIKIAQVHLAACECLVGMVEVFCPAQKIDSSLYRELLQLYNVEKNESAKSVMKKSLDMLEDSFKDTMHD
jgi:proteasome component ECM29